METKTDAAAVSTNGSGNGKATPSLPTATVVVTFTAELPVTLFGGTDDLTEVTAAMEALGLKVGADKIKVNSIDFKKGTFGGIK